MKEEKSEFQETMFRVYLRKLSIPLIQIVMAVSLVWSFLVFPMDLYIPSQKQKSLILKWRVILTLFFAWPLLATASSKWIRKHIGFFYSINMLATFLISSYFLMKLDAFMRSYTYVLYFGPLWLVISPLNLKKRLIYTLCSYIFILLGTLLAIGLKPMMFVSFALVLLGASMMSVAIGHFCYYQLNRQRFFDRREIEKARRDLRSAQERSDELLINILPKTIFDELKSGEEYIADEFQEASVLFADIVNFTPLTQKLSAEKIVNILDDMFTRFDRIVAKMNLEKIKTIGDEYFVTSGVPEPNENHALQAAELALRFQEEIQQFQRSDGNPFNLRIGINSGPLVGGIIGEEKFVYDVWGKTVNLGSRMETHGIPGEIQITPSTKKRLGSVGVFDFERRGIIDVKGFGMMETFLLKSEDYEN